MKKELANQSIENNENGVRADIEFHLGGDLEQTLSKLTVPQSPLKLNQKIDDWYMFDSKDPILDGFFCYGTQDPSTSEYPLHIEAQRALGFKSEINLHYGRCFLNPKKIEVFKKIMNYLISKEIPTYMTVTDENGGEEYMVRGHNPITDTDIHNDKFSLEKLLEDNN